MMMSALAAIAAGDDNGKAIAKEIINVSKDGTECTAFEECSQLVEDGEDIDYEGKSGPADLNDTGSAQQGHHRHLPVQRRQHVQADRLRLRRRRVAAQVA